jgi:long-chain acyl-CoA synthetase
MNPYIVGLIVPLVVTLFFCNNSNNKHPKRRAVPVEVGGESGLAVRNVRFSSPVETAWEGVRTLAELFEEACRKHGERILLGTRRVLSREVEMSQDGRSFEKLHLGEYEWVSYDEAFDAVSWFASGLVSLGHVKEERAAIFADTRQEWFIALQVNSLFFEEQTLKLILKLCRLIFEIIKILN